MLKKLFLRKKMIAMLIGLALELLVSLGIEMDPELKKQLMQAILAIVGIFCGGQALSDGLSKGATSAGNGEK